MSIEVQVDDRAVRIRYTGLDAWWTARRSLEIPVMRIRSARVAPVDQLRETLGLRLLGTYVPGVATAGLFLWRPRRSGARQIWSVFRDDEALVIDTDIAGTDRVVVQHPDRHDLAWWIGERIPERS